MYINPLTFIIWHLKGEQSNLAPTSDGTEYSFDPNTDKVPMNPYNF